MSLYIGNDNNGNGLLHITTNKHNIYDMKGGVLPDTIFHNDLEFSGYELYDIIEGSVGYYWASGNDRYNKTYYNYSCAGFHRLDDSDVTSYLLLDDYNNTVPTNRIQWLYGDFTSLSPVYIPGWRAIGPVVYTRDVRGNRFSPVHSTAKKLLVLKKTKLIDGPGVNIKRGVFNVGNSDLYDFTYAFLGNLVTYPDAIHIGNQLTLIDTKEVGGSISIKSNPSQTVISKGGFEIFNSSVGQYLPGIGVLHTFNIGVINKYRNIFLMELKLNGYYTIRYIDTSINSVRAASTFIATGSSTHVFSVHNDTLAPRLYAKESNGGIYLHSTGYTDRVKITIEDFT